MKQKNKTAVEWLALYIKGITSLNCDEVIEQAKEMEKKQICNAWENGIENCGEFNNPTIINSKQYYNETYEAKED